MPILQSRPTSSPRAATASAPWTSRRLPRGTSIGGARPKALLTDGGRLLIAKSSSTTDTRPAVKAEAVAMMLAERAGLSVAPFEVVQAADKDVLLVERFDRPARTLPDGTRGYARRHALEAHRARPDGDELAALQLRRVCSHDPRRGMDRGADDAARAVHPARIQHLRREQHDHLRNLAAFWDSPQLDLTPGEADQIINHVEAAVQDHWDEACERALVTTAEKKLLWGRELCNPCIYYDEA